MNHTVLDRQSIFDIAVQQCGSAEAAFDLALRKGLSMTDYLPVGENIEISEPQNRRIVDYYAANGLKPATGLTDEQMTDVIDEGINFMGIEVDFIVS